VNGTLFFTPNDGTTGSELWKSDGTTAGTVQVKDIDPGSGSAFGGYYGGGNLTNVNGKLFFSANDGTHGTEFWKSNGTAAGTVQVKDINPGSGSSNAGHVTNVNGTLFFAANDGTKGTELWKSNGTTAGTVRVKDINPGSYGGVSSYSQFANVHGTLFFAANDGTHGTELWKSNGTTAGTVEVKNIRPGSRGGISGNLTNVNGTLFFAANDGTHGTELWKSDGTKAGTVQVKNIQPDGGYYSYGSLPSNLTNVNGTLFFVANDGTTGKELWMSNGTTAGTVQVKDIRPGQGGSFGGYYATTGNLTNVNGTLFFSANDGVTGNELWKATAPPAAARASLGKVTISGTTAHVAIACAGENGQNCSVALTMSAKKKKKTVVVGKAKKTVAAGGHAVVKISLNSAGKKLLEQSHTLHVSLAASQDNKKIGTKKLTFTKKH
jgi:ELWxxDGT repeat protein